MRFDDKEFDEKAKKTMKTLDKLNEKLSFDAVARKSDAALNEMVDNVEKIADKAYTIVDRVIDKIKDSIATKIFSFLSDTIVGQVKSGWSKYAEMTQAVGTLAAQGHKMEVINEVLERLSFFSDETNYNFNNMLNNISKFTAAGVKLEDAEVALEGIAGMAGLSGVNAQRAAIAMDQMAQAMGSYLKKADWVSIQTANLDTMEFRQTLIDTALELGTLKKAANNTYVSLRATSKTGKNAFSVQTGFLESLTQGAWATTEVMVETYKKYGAAVSNVYDKVEAEGITASEAINDLTIENKSLLEQYQKQYNVTSEIAEQELNKISLIRKATNEEIDQYATLHKVSKKVASATLNSNYDKMLKDWQKRTHKTLEETERDLDQWAGWTNSKALKAFTNAQEARTFEDVINSVKEAVSSNWRSIYTSIFGDYAEAKKLWTDMANGLVDLFAGKLYDIAAMFKEWKGLEPGEGGRIDLWQGLYAFAYGIRDIIEEVREVWNNLITDGEKGLSVLQTLTLKIKEAGFRFYTFVDSLINEGFFADITEALHNIKAFIDQIFGAFYDGVRDAVPGGEFFKGLLLDFAHILKELTSNFKLSDEAVDGLRRTFKGLTIILNKSKKTFVEILVKVVLPILNAVFSVLGNIVEVVLTITGTLGDIIEYFMPLDSETSALVTILEVLTDVLTSIVKIVGKGIMVALKAVVPLIGVVIGSVATLIEGLKDLFTMKSIKMGGDNKLFGSFVELKNRILEAWAPLESFNETINKYKNGKGLINFLNLFADITEGIGNRLLLTVDAVVGFFEVLSESKFGKAFSYAIKVLRWFIRAGLWLFNNLLVPALKEIITELGLTIESVKGIIDERGILGLLDLIQEVFKTGIFGSIVNTINLINSVLGANGLGKLFNKGAKALESMAGYFNAAKVNQAAEILLKIVAALTLLYTLLALITFLPVDTYDKMKDAMIDMAIALGTVVGAVFVISAAAALAGGNLIAMAAGFVGVAVAITTALWALNAMVDWMDKVEVDVIKKGLDQLMDILDAYAWFLLKTIGPLTLVAGKFQGDIGGIGIAMAGMAASIWILMKTLEGIGNVDASNFETLFNFLTGIYAVLAASTALMILAANGKDVHGIAIAIASIGVSLAAVKMIFPLCKDIAAEKDTFMDAQQALMTFGLFMVAFAASMYFVTSGVNGILSGIASILLFKAFINIVLSDILPVVDAFATLVVKISDTLSGGWVNDDGSFNVAKVLSLVSALTLIIAGITVFIKNFRLIFDIWAEMDPISIIAIAASIVGSLAIIAQLLIPAIEELNEMTKSNSILDNATLLGLIALLFSPIYVIITGFSKVMDKYTELYGKWKNAKYSLNIGLITREFNGAASVMQSIMLTVLGVYVAMIGLLYMATSLPKMSDENWKALMTLLIGTVAILVLSIWPMLIFFGEVMSNMYKQLQGAGNINRKTFLALGKANLEDTFTAVIRYVSQTLQIVAGLLPIIMVGMGVLAYVAAQSEKFDKFKEAFLIMAVALAAILIGVAVVTGILMHGLTKANTLLNLSNSSTAAAYNAILGVIAIVLLFATVMFGVMAKVAYEIGTMPNQNGEYEQFISSLKWLGLMVAGTLAAIGAFTWLMLKAIKGNAIENWTGQFQSTKYYTQFAELIVVMAGMAAILLIMGTVLLPAVKNLQRMQTDKIIFTFIGIIGTILVSLGAFMGMTAIDKVQDYAATGERILSIIKMIVATVVPLLSIAISLHLVVNALKKLEGIDEAKLGMIKKIFIVFGVIAGVAWALAAASSFVPGIMAGVAAVSVLVIAIGAAALLIAYAAEKIYGIYRDWSGIQEVVGKATALNNAKGFVDGVNEATGECVDAVTNQGEAVNEAGSKVYQSRSPSRVWKNFGKWIDQGLALGINKNTKDVVRASRNLANMTNSVFADDLEIASPSKVFYKNGRFIVAGLQDGITSQKTSLSDTMSDLGESLANSINSGFENVNIDIWGGKDPIETIKEGIKDVDAGSILGKIFGLDEGSEKDWSKAHYSDEYLRMVKTVTNSELNALSHAEAMGGKTPDWFANRWVVPEKSTGTKLAGKAKTFLKDVFDDVISSDTIKGIAEDLGIEIGDNATGKTVMDSITDKILGTEENPGVFGTVGQAIRSGDWTGLGEDIGQLFGDGIVNKVTHSNIGQRIHGILNGDWKRVFGSTYTDLIDFGSVESANSDEIIQTLEMDAKQLAEIQDTVKDKAVKEFLTKYLSGGGENSQMKILLPVGVDSSELFWNVEEDFVKRMPELIRSIANGAYKAMYDENGKMIGYEYQMTQEQIDALYQKWKVNSPSKVTEDLYKSVCDGELKGLNDGQKSVLDALEDSTSEQYRVLSLGIQGLDSLGKSGAFSPSIVPVIDTAGFGTLNSLMSPYMNGKVTASLDFTNSFGSIATAQQALANAVNSMARDIIGALNIGELIKVDVNSTVNDDNLFDHFVTIDRQEYNRTGRHAW